MGHPHPPAYVSRATLAEQLDMAESTVDDFVRRGILPKPIRLSTGCVRWSWIEVEAAVGSLKVEGPQEQPADPYLAGARNVTKITERRRGSP